MPNISKLERMRRERTVTRWLKQPESTFWKEYLPGSTVSLPANRNQRLLAATTFFSVSVVAVVQALRHILGR